MASGDDDVERVRARGHPKRHRRPQRHGRRLRCRHRAPRPRGQPPRRLGPRRRGPAQRHGGAARDGTGVVSAQGRRPELATKEDDRPLLLDRRGVRPDWEHGVYGAPRRFASKCCGLRQRGRRRLRVASPYRRGHADSRRAVRPRRARRHARRRRRAWRSLARVALGGRGRRRGCQGGDGRRFQARHARLRFRLHGFHRRARHRIHRL
mmetsp:Transcript_19878/g.67275  ORF Transcript_19878/g.67275 Transcript_19878/m.67275 type:complete len:208 (+) Transcript_19878:932-1555(+)